MDLFLNERDIYKVNKLLTKAKPFTCYEEVFDILKLKTDERFVISFLNLYAVQNALDNDDFFNALIESDLLLLDGIAMRMLYKILRLPYKKNMNGSDFIPELIQQNLQKRFMVFGTNEESLKLFAERNAHLQISHQIDGFKEFTTYCDAVKMHEAEVILLGMGMPKQEILSSKLDGNFLIINGGAIVDYLAGYKKRAPNFIIKMNLEWLYRIFYEPKRLFGRYAFGFVITLRISATYFTRYKVALSS